MILRRRILDPERLLAVARALEPRASLVDGVLDWEDGPSLDAMAAHLTTTFGPVRLVAADYLGASWIAGPRAVPPSRWSIGPLVPQRSSSWCCAPGEPGDRSDRTPRHPRMGWLVSPRPPVTIPYPRRWRASCSRVEPSPADRPTRSSWSHVSATSASGPRPGPGSTNRADRPHRAPHSRSTKRPARGQPARWRSRRTRRRPERRQDR